jgi:hypothetical protein
LQIVGVSKRASLAISSPEMGMTACPWKRIGKAGSPMPQKVYQERTSFASTAKQRRLEGGDFDIQIEHILSGNYHQMSINLVA